MAFVQGKDKLVQLTYSFIFNRADNIWNHIYEFEHDLADFFKSKQLEAEVITFVEGSSGARTLFIRDVSKTMVLKNDKDVMRIGDMPMKKPEKSFKTTQKLVDQVNKSYTKGSK